MDVKNYINKQVDKREENGPADSVPVIFVSNVNQNGDLTKSGLWNDSTKRFVIVGLIIIFLVCAFFLRRIITPMILSCLMVFYLKPVVFAIQNKWNISHKLSVIIVFGLFLIIVLGISALCGFSIYNQALNLYDLISNSLANLPDSILNLLGGEDSSLGRIFKEYIDSTQNTEINQQIRSIFQNIGGNLLSFVQSITSKIGWFFFIYGFSFFVVWEMKNQNKNHDEFTIAGYEYDIEMGKKHLTFIWRRFLWGQLILLLISLLVYTVLYFILGVKYALILGVAVSVTRMIPYIGSFFAWGVVALVALFQGYTILGLKPFSYAVMVVLISFLIDKLMDGFIQPKYMAQTLKVHPAAVLTSALICGRTMGFLGIFLSAPLAATLKLILSYIFRKLGDKDPWPNFETESDSLTMKEYFDKTQMQIIKMYDKLKYHTVNLKSHLAEITGGKKHGSNGIKD